MKMPKRYTYLLLKDVVGLSGSVMDNAKMANSVFPTNSHEAQIRRDYWIRSRAYLQALSTRIDRFIEAPDALTYHDENARKTKGVSVKELVEIVDLIDSEMNLLTEQLKSETERYKNLK